MEYFFGVTVLSRLFFAGQKSSIAFFAAATNSYEMFVGDNFLLGPTGSGRGTSFCYLPKHLENGCVARRAGTGSQGQLAWPATLGGHRDPDDVTF